MHVILLERVPKLGEMGEEVRVRDGFAAAFAAQSQVNLLQRHLPAHPAREPGHKRPRGSEAAAMRSPGAIVRCALPSANQRRDTSGRHFEASCAALRPPTPVSGALAG